MLSIHMQHVSTSVSAVGQTRCVMQVVRLSSQDVPTAYAFELEAATIVQPEEVEAAVQCVVAGAPVLA